MKMVRNDSTLGGLATTTSESLSWILVFSALATKTLVLAVLVCTTEPRMVLLWEDTLNTFPFLDPRFLECCWRLLVPSSGENDDEFHQVRRRKDQGSCFVLTYLFVELAFWWGCWETRKSKIIDFRKDLLMTLWWQNECRTCFNERLKRLNFS